jgi:uncharacterized membrane protein
MPMKTHELHPALVHFPLVLLPLAAATDAFALLSRNRRLERTGRGLWLGVAGSAALGGGAGLAASREVKPNQREADDMMFVHGIGNAALLTLTTGIAIWRQRRAPGPVSTSLGVLGAVASFYTAYLGGEMVYAHGLGVNGRASSPDLLSRDAPRALITDALRGAGWLFRRTRELFDRGRALEPRAFGTEEVSNRLTRG